MSFKEQLKNEILPKAVEYYNSGTGINESIVKAASDFHLNLDQTDRLLETMNTARTIAYYEKNAEDRTQSFDIADKDTVHRMLFEDKTEKRASADSDGWVDYSFYDGPDRNYRHTVESDGSIEKMAAENEPGVKEFSRRQVLDKVAAYRNSLAEQHTFASGREDMAKDWLASSISKLASELSKGYSPGENYALFKAAASGMPEVVAAVDAAIDPFVKEESRQYARQIKRANVVDDSAVASQLDLAREVSDGIRMVDKMHGIVESLAAKEAEVKDLLARYQRTEVPSKTDFFGCSAVEKSAADKDDKKPKKPKDSKSDGWMGNVIKNLPDAPAGVKNISDYLSGAAYDPKKIDEIVNPKKQKGTSLKEYVNNMRRSDIISELYEEDPILSEASPEEVSRAYSTLVQSAPEASLNKEVVRAILRQSVNSVAVSPFDAKQWSDFDKTILENKKINAQLAGRMKL